MRILLLEPDEYYHTHCRESFGSLGEVMISRDGEEGRALLEKVSPDVLVMELLFPGEATTGFRFLQDVQTYREHRKPLSIVVFSHLDNLEDIEHALNLGVAGYFVKGRDTVNDVKKLLLSLNPT